MKNKNGFSLIEITIVILLVSILAVVSYPYFIGVSYESKKSRVNNDLQTLSNAMIRYYTMQGTWPVTINDLVPDYIDKAMLDPWGHPYSIYVANKSGKSESFVGCISKAYKNKDLSGQFTTTSEILWQPVDSE